MKDRNARELLVWLYCEMRVCVCNDQNIDYSCIYTGIFLVIVQNDWYAPVEWNRQFIIRGARWDENSKLDLKEKECVVCRVDLIELPQVRVQCPTSQNTAFSLRVEQNVRNFFTASRDCREEPPQLLPFIYLDVKCNNLYSYKWELELFA